MSTVVRVGIICCRDCLECDVSYYILFFQRTVYLHVDRNDLTGSLPSELGLISPMSEYGRRAVAVKVVSFSRAASNDNISSSFSYVSVEVAMSQNDFGGSIPSEIGNLGALRKSMGVAACRCCCAAPS